MSRSASVAAQRSLVPHTFARWLSLAVLFVNIFVTAMAGLFLYQSRAQFRERAQVTVENLSQVLESDVAALIERTDMLLLSVIDEVAQARGPDGLAWARLNPALVRLAGRMPELSGLRLADSQGTVRASAPLDVGQARISIADRDYFLRPRDDPHAGLVISKPVYSRIEGTWVVVLARRLSQADGSFAGIISASIEVERFAQMFAALKLGPQGSVSLWDEGPTIIARFPQTVGGATTWGSSAAGPALASFVRSGKAAGAVETRSGVDGIARTFHFRRLNGLPLILSMGEAESDYLAPWRREAIPILGLTALFIGVTVVFSLIVHGGWRQLGQAIGALRDSEERFRTMADYTYDWEYWEGPNSEILYITPSCERVTGYSAAEFRQNPHLLHVVVHPEDRAMMHAHILDARHQDAAALDFRIVTKSGETRWIAHGCRAVHWGGDRFMGHRVSNRDITDRKRLEEKLRELNDTLETRVEEEVAKNREKDHLLIQQSRLAAMGEMVHNIAHQWRQPLNALSIIVNNIKDDFDYHELSSERLAAAVAQSTRLLEQMSTTIDDFRDFFRPDREPSNFDIDRALDEALLIVDASLRNNNITVHKTAAPGLVCSGFPNQFSQAVLNVLVNAKEAIRDRGVRDGQLTIRLDSENDTARLSIRDNGGGIPADVLPKIFEPYFTTKEKGSGVGLYMTKMILERNFHGSIAVTNEDAGTLVAISIPLTRGNTVDE